MAGCTQLAAVRRVVTGPAVGVLSLGTIVVRYRRERESIGVRVCAGHAAVIDGDRLS